MKKLFKVGVVIVVLIVVALVASFYFLGSIVKKGVETVGPTITKTEFKLGGVTLSLLSGHAKFSELVVGNPEGFKSAFAMKMGSVSASVQPSSVFSDKVVVKSVNIQSPEITFEGRVGGGNNLKQLLANVEAATGGGDPNTPKGTIEPGPKKAEQKIQVDDLVLSGAKVHLSLTELGGKATTVTIPDIHLTNLGTDSGGLTPAELTRKILIPILQSTIRAATGALADVGKNAADAVKEIGDNPVGAAGKVTKGVTDLLRKKP